MLAMAQSSPDDLLTVREAAGLLRINYDTLLRWLAKGVIPYVSVGPTNLKRVYRRDVDRLKREVGSA